MSRTKEYPRYHVISFRVTQDEMEALKQLRKSRKTTVDKLVREALAGTDFPVHHIDRSDHFSSACAG